jgi:hypothetical protein
MVPYGPYPDIKIDDTTPSFVGTVTAALDTIRGQPTGDRLLQEICAHAPAFAAWGPGKIKIVLPMKNVEVKSFFTGKTTTVKKKFKASEGGSRAVALNEVHAKGGGGCGSAVFWNPLVKAIPGIGERPPFIGLAHELIHAWHNALGTMKNGYDDEESFTVGLGAYMNPGANGITENMIRLEHGVPIRHRY